MTVVLFLISLAALQRSPGYRSILLSMALGLFSLKNIVLTYLYLVDDLPDLHPLMFADAVVTGIILLRLMFINKKEETPATGESQTTEEPSMAEEPPGV